jgi:hypothetical protein
MVTTSFSVRSVDLDQQPYKAHKIPSGLAGFRFTQSQSAQAAELRSQVVVRQ